MRGGDAFLISRHLPTLSTIDACCWAYQRKSVEKAKDTTFYFVSLIWKFLPSLGDLETQAPHQERDAAWLIYFSPSAC
jgi:hypothetical protein